jgi:hypothetical protein
VGEVLYHMSVAPALMVADVSLITKERRMAQAMLRHFPQGVFDWLNKVATRHRGRDLRRADLAREYDEATSRILATLANVKDDDFPKSARYPDWDPLLSGDVTLTQLFHYVRAHFESHEPDIRKKVAHVGRG